MIDAPPENRRYRGEFLLVLLVLLGLVSGFAVPARADTLPVDQIKKGMTGYGKTVFEGTRIDTFPVRVSGILRNVMPDMDMILIRTPSKFLRHTKIMSGMSGSPIYINGKLIGALAYSWPFETEPLAGVTPIENILSSNRMSGPTLQGRNMSHIRTPVLAGGFPPSVLDAVQTRLRDRGLNARFVTGGSLSGGAAGTPADTPGASLAPGSAVGAQLMRGDLNMTAIGTVTYREGPRVFAFGHPFLGAGPIQMPMTTATVETYMPSLRSSFKMATPLQPVGSILEDRQAAIVGREGVRADMLPMTIELAVPGEQYRRSFRVELIRNRFLTPGLINSAVSSFARSQLNQMGINQIETRVQIDLKGHRNIEFTQTNLASASFDPWTFLPINALWSNRFTTPRVRNVHITISLQHDQESARITDMWTDRSVLQPGDHVRVFTRIDPFRGESFVKSTRIRIPGGLSGSEVRIRVLPARQLASLEAPPHTLSQLITRLNELASPNELGVLLEFARVSLKAEGNRMDDMPLSMAAAYQKAMGTSVKPQPSSRQVVVPTRWVLEGEYEITLPLEPMD